MNEFVTETNILSSNQTTKVQVKETNWLGLIAIGVLALIVLRALG